MGINMSDNQNWSGMGEQIKGALTEALQTGDFKNLNDLVAQTVTNTLNEVGINITPNSGDSEGFFAGDRTDAQAALEKEEQNGDQQNWQAQIQKQEERMRLRQEQMRKQEQEMRARQEQMRKQEQQMRVRQEQQMRAKQEQMRKQEQQMRRRQEQVQVRQKKANLPSVKFNRTGRVSNVLYQVFGGIGLGFTGIIAFIYLFVSIAGGATVRGWIVNFAFLAFFFGMIRHGIGQRRRLKRATRYMQLCDNKMYGEIEDLARATGKSKRYVIKDIQKMLALSMFPEGHLDEQKTCLMLNDTVYKQYLEAENSRKLREAEGRKALEDKKNTGKPEESIAQETLNEQETELNTMIAEGMECIHKLKALNDKIPGEVISDKLFRLEGLLRNIFDSLVEHPEQMHRMHKLMDYYLPTTLKLVEAYADFDRISTPGEEITAAKAEIENTLDTINQAFTELLNNLFQDAVFDATTDAQVLKTMLAREGLTREMELSASSQEL